MVDSALNIFPQTMNRLINQLINLLINDEAVYKTAPATPGLLNIASLHAEKQQ